MQDPLRQLDENLLQRAAGPYSLGQLWSSVRCSEWNSRGQVFGPLVPPIKSIDYLTRTFVSGKP